LPPLKTRREGKGKPKPKRKRDSGAAEREIPPRSSSSMTSILDMKAGPPDYWAEISNFFLPLKYLITNDRFDAMVRDIDLYYLINGVFWIFVALSCGYYAFQRLFQVGPACRNPIPILTLQSPSMRHLQLHFSFEGLLGQFAVYK